MTQRTIDSFIITRLCKTCRSIDFERLCTSNDTGEEKYYSARLGTAQEIIAKFESRECSLCVVIGKSLVRKQKLSIFARGTGNFTLRREIYAKYSLRSAETVNCIRLNVSMHSLVFARLLSFQLCTNSIPHVRDFREISATNQRLMPPSGRRIGHHYEPRLLQQWMSNCEHYHGNSCEQPDWRMADNIQPLALRVVDVHQSCIVDAPPVCQYLALSYVWGPTHKNKLVLTKKTIKQLQKPGQLLLEDIPRTIQDALIVTQSVGVRYLWIDSLCIIQDDDNEDSRQLLHMDCVYANAYATIIAANAIHADFGIAGVNADRMRHPRQAVVRVSDSIQLMRSSRWYVGTAYDDSPWKRRAWTMQEMLLSRRTIMFTDEEIFWRCQNATWCESVVLEPYSMGTEPKISFEPTFGCYERGQEQSSLTFKPENAYHVIMKYSKRSMTNSSDALNAIQGYLRRLHKMFPYAASFWGHFTVLRFDESLAWEGGDCIRRVAKHTTHDSNGCHRIAFPSWSWLGWTFERSIFKFLRKLPYRLAVLKPELDFYHVSVDGKVRPLAPHAYRSQYLQPLDTSALDMAIAGKWKGAGKIEVEHDSEEVFLDSGRLCFWTSAAKLTANKQEGWLKHIHKWVLMHEGSETLAVGTMSEYGCHISTTETPHHFIVVARVHDDEEINKVLSKLHVLMVEWIDEEKRIARRIGAGVVDEEAWVAVQPEWCQVILT